MGARKGISTSRMTKKIIGVKILRIKSGVISTAFIAGCIVHTRRERVECTIRPTELIVKNYHDK